MTSVSLYCPRHRPLILYIQFSPLPVTETNFTYCFDGLDYSSLTFLLIWLLLRYQLIRVNAGLGESCEWLEMFGDVGMVIFCVSLSDYDQFSADGNGCLTNKMLQSRVFFESIVTHPTFDHMNFLLLLNKSDWFVKKIGQVPLTQCDWFDDFNPVPVTSCDLAHQAYQYIAVKFKRLYSSLANKKLYVSLVEDFEPDAVHEALKYSTEILKWDEVRDNGYVTDDSDSFYSDSGSD